MQPGNQADDNASDIDDEDNYGDMLDMKSVKDREERGTVIRRDEPSDCPLTIYSEGQYQDRIDPDIDLEFSNVDTLEKELQHSI
ncbi:hypothetical protein L5515_019705 [Caenorhabditis briggsae]|uniref:Uncharacterized protein n=1 Tax=Caenorhabditis briggsae TaxID=6238 RepID=A0AAE9FPY6_CAEBR|nr:hypothetical protein L5515_019705 [Caenorhabditis briggsae]